MMSNSLSRPSEFEYQGKSLQIAMTCHDNKMYLQASFGVISTTVQLLRLGMQVYVDFQGGCSHVDLAKSRLVASFMQKSKDDYLLIIDSDHGFGFNDVAILLEQDKDIIAGACVKKDFPISHVDVPIDTQCKSPKYWEATECDLLGGGFLLIKRSAIEKIVAYMKSVGATPAAYPDDFEYYFLFKSEIIKDVSGAATFYTEDYAFCNLAKQAGLKLYAHFGTSITHIGFHHYANDERNRVISEAVKRAMS